MDADRNPVDTSCGKREEDDRKLRFLRQKLTDSITRGGLVTDKQLDAALAKRSATLAKFK